MRKLIAVVIFICAGLAHADSSFDRQFKLRDSYDNQDRWKAEEQARRLNQQKLEINQLRIDCMNNAMDEGAMSRCSTKFPEQEITRTDYKCVQDCTNRKYEYGYCKSRCSY